MTVIAWDGKSIATDRQMTAGDVAFTAVKMARLSDGTVLANSGDAGASFELRSWYEAGAKPENYPASQATEDWSRLIVMKPDGSVIVYEKKPYPVPVLDPFSAWGSGRDFALGAMARGATAAEAVEIACRFDINCGMGVDVLHHAESKG